MHQQQRARLSIAACTSRQFFSYFQVQIKELVIRNKAQTRFNTAAEMLHFTIFKIQTDSLLKNMKQSTGTWSVAAYKEIRIETLVQPITDTSLWFNYHTVVYLKTAVLSTAVPSNRINYILFTSSNLDYNTLTHTYLLTVCHWLFTASMPAAVGHVQYWLCTQALSEILL